MAARRRSPWLLGGGLVLVVALVGAAFMILEETPAEEPRTADAPLTVRGDAGPEMALPAPAEAPPDDTSPIATPPDDVAPGETVGGRILRLADRSPITRAEVRSRRSRVLTAREDGGFRLTDVDRDERFLELQLGDRVLRVELPDDGVGRTDLVLVVDTGWLLRGHVFAERSGPLVGARVSCGDVSAETGKGGQFVLRDVTGGPGDVVVAARAPWSIGEQVAVRLPVDVRVVDGVEFWLEPSGAIMGVVTGPDGPTVSAPVRLRVAFGDDGVITEAPPLEGRVQTSGQYQIDSVPPGRYLVAIGGRPLAESSPPAREPSHAVEQWYPDVIVTAGAATRLDIALDEGAVVEGRVTDGTGVSLPGLAVEAYRRLRWPASSDAGEAAAMVDDLRLGTLRGADGRRDLVLAGPARTTITDDRGAYRLSDLPPGELLVTARDPRQVGQRPQERELWLEAGRYYGGVDFVVDDGLTLRGRVYDARGAPAAGARVALVPAEGARVLSAEDSIFAEDDGAFEFTGLAAGGLRLFVSHPGHLTTWLDVTPGGPELRIDLAPAIVVEGRVLDARTLAPVVNFRVEADSDTMTMTRDWTDAEGRFVIDSLEDRDHVITVSADGYEPRSVAGVRPSGSGAPLEFHLTPLP